MIIPIKLSKMKHIKKFTILSLAAALAIAGCRDKKTAQQPQLKTEADEQVVDTTVYGVCGDGTAMHTLQLITDSGDTLEYLIEDEGDMASDVQGGLLSGDKVAVTSVEVEGEKIARKVINLTTLLGKWTSIDKNFEIEEDGTVKSFLKAEQRPWTSWKILNGQLLLNIDTFDINTLGADSLYIENKSGIFAFKRQKTN